MKKGKAQAKRQFFLFLHHFFECTPTRLRFPGAIAVFASVVRGRNSACIDSYRWLSGTLTTCAICDHNMLKKVAKNSSIQSPSNNNWRRFQLWLVLSIKHRAPGTTLNRNVRGRRETVPLNLSQLCLIVLSWKLHDRNVGSVQFERHHHQLMEKRK